MGKNWKKTGKGKGKVSKAVISYVNKALDRRIEDKYATQSLVSAFGSVGNDWVDVCLSNPTEGTDVINRVGRTINIKSIEMRGTIANGSYSGTTADDGYNTLRCIVGTWQVESPLTGTGASIDQPIQKDAGAGNALIRKYSDKYIALNTTGTYNKVTTTGFVPELKTFKYYKRFKKPLQIKFSDSGATAADKFLVISMISDSSVVPHVGFTNGYILLRYEDA